MVSACRTISHYIALRSGFRCSALDRPVHSAERETSSLLDAAEQLERQACACTMRGRLALIDGRAGAG